jgi:dienelactone hydrolase
MNRLLLISFAWLLTQSAQAHTVTLVTEGTTNHPALILVKGKFEPEAHRESITEFLAIAARQGRAVVFFDSPGGSIGTGISLGQIIRQRGFNTAVADYTTCTSACALAWLGGRERFMGTNARIGFHAASVSRDNRDFSAKGTAAAKDYLHHNVGITDYSAISYLTEAPPTSINWLTVNEVARFRIDDVKAFSLSQDEWAWARSASNASPRIGTYLLGVSASKASAEVPATSPLAVRSTVEDGYRIEEGFLHTKIKGRLVLLQALVIKKADAAGKLPIMLFTHGTVASPKGRQEMTPRGVKDTNLRMVRDYARRGWLSVYVLRRGYGQSDGPAHVVSLRCDTTIPTYQDFINADADDLEAALTFIGQREDADTSRVVAFGASGGGAAVVALGARNIPGLQLVVNVSGGLKLSACTAGSNHERLVAAMRHYGTTSRVTNLWYYAKNDRTFPEDTVAEMRTAFLEGGAYSRLTSYENVMDSKTGEEVDGHLLWSKRASAVMIDVDGFLRSKNLPTWDFNDVSTLANKVGTKKDVPSILELYIASPGYKALAQSTTSETSFTDNYNSATLEDAKQGAISACQKRYPGHTCKIVDPPDSQPPPPEEAAKVKAPDAEKPVTP